ncbi:COX15/CtaA family protein [Pelagibacterales bacterium SAG-MED34]|nr:COX15/CtaA family protein [Pelagibacterales bacterium SAG-MED34]
MYSENIKVNNQLSTWLISMFWIISVMIIVGGLTRLTDSGLSITQWQLFSGFLPPLNNSEWIMYFDLYKKIPEFKLQNYDMSMQEFKIIFWWEWAHRFMGRLIGISFLIPLIYFTFKIKFKKLISLYFIFTLICFQGFIGWYMVSSGLVDRVDVSHFRLSVHLLMAFFILSLIFWNYLKIKVKTNIYDTINLIYPFSFLFLVFLQISIGAFVSGMDAGKIYNSWPLMGDSIFPNDNSISNLFRLSAFSDPSLVQFIHRKLAYLIGLFYLYLLFYIYKNQKSDLYVSVNILGFFIILQIILGIFTLLYGAQILVASMHQISSIFLVASCIYFLFINTKTNSQLSS